jgi:hypothetical protein
MISPPEIFKKDEAVPFVRAGLLVNDETAYPEIIPISPFQKKPSVKHFLFWSCLDTGREDMPTCRVVEYNPEQTSTSLQK